MKWTEFKLKIKEAIMLGPIMQMESRLDKIISEICEHRRISIDGFRNKFTCHDCRAELTYGSWEINHENSDNETEKTGRVQLKDAKKSIRKQNVNRAKKNDIREQKTRFPSEGDEE